MDLFQLYNYLFGKQEVPDMEGLLNHSRLMGIPTYNDTTGYGLRGRLQDIWKQIEENSSEVAPPKTDVDRFNPHSKRDLQRLEMMQLFEDEEIQRNRLNAMRRFM